MTPDFPTGSPLKCYKNIYFDIAMTIVSNVQIFCINILYNYDSIVQNISSIKAYISQNIDIIGIDNDASI